MTIEASDGGRIRKRIIARLCLFLVMCFLAMALSYWQPAWGIEWYGTMERFLTVLWVILSLVTTALLTYSANSEIMIGSLLHYSKEQDNSEKTKRTMACKKVNDGILLYVIVVLIGVILCANCPLVVPIILVGPVLVGFVMFFDWKVKELCEWIISNAVENSSKSMNGGEKKVYERQLAVERQSYEQACDVFWKLDLPIMIGVVLITIISMVVFPGGTKNIFNDGSYAIGFASGSTVLQLLVGNISFSVIGFLSVR